MIHDLDRLNLRAFVTESNGIEGIWREPLWKELEAHNELLLVDKGELRVEHMMRLVDQLEPGARLRQLPGQDVIVGSYTPPPGGPEILDRLRQLLGYANENAEDPWTIHIRYESLHPFTDGNGRSGRALWLWCMLQWRGSTAMSIVNQRQFLHEFYYQTLSHVGRA